MSAVGFRRMIIRPGKAAKMPLPIRPHMLRHAFGLCPSECRPRYAQTASLFRPQEYSARSALTELAPDRFKDFWRSTRGFACPRPS
jgi:hypothetical protein